MKLSEQQKEIALLVANEVSPNYPVRIKGDEDLFEFAARFLAALPKPYPVGYVDSKVVDHLRAGVRYGGARISPRIDEEDGLACPIYAATPQPDDVRDAERYRWCKENPDRAASVFDNLGPSYFDSEIDMFMRERAPIAPPASAQKPIA